MSVGFDGMGQLLTIYFGFVRHLKKKREYIEAVHRIQEACDSVRWEVLYNILI
jgi:hypothetical protein